MESTLLDSEIKTALQVNIVRQRVESSGILLGSGVTYYTIQLCKIYSGEQRYSEKRLVDFYALNEELKSRAYRGLPSLPPKTIIPVKGQEQQEKRRMELVNYLRVLVERRDTRNSQELVEFLDLDEFAPEMLISKPQLITRWNCNSSTLFCMEGVKQQHCVQQCLFLAKHNLFVLALNTSNYVKGKKLSKQQLNQSCSRLQLFSFKHLS